MGKYEEKDYGKRKGERKKTMERGKGKGSRMMAYLKPNSTIG